MAEGFRANVVAVPDDDTMSVDSFPGSPMYKPPFTWALPSSPWVAATSAEPLWPTERETTDPLSCSGMFGFSSLCAVALSHVVFDERFLWHSVVACCSVLVLLCACSL